MTRFERIVLRHQVDARVRERIAHAGKPRPDGQPLLADQVSEWMPFARVPKRASIAIARGR